MTDFDILVQWGVLFAAGLFMLVRGQLTIFHPSSIYLTFHAIVFCARPTFVKYFEFDTVWKYMRLNPDPELLRQTLWLSSASLIIFITCFSIATSAKGVKDLGGTFEPTSGMRRAYFIMLIIFLPLGLYSIFFANVQIERIGGVAIMTGTSGYVNDAQQVLIPICILCIVLFRWKIWAFIPFLIFAYFRANQGWGRWSIILPFLAIVMFYCWNKRKDFPPIRWLIPVPFLFIIFNQLSHNRMYIKFLFKDSSETTIVETVDSHEDKQFAFQKQWDTLDFANFDFLAYIIDKVPRETGRYTYGVQHLQLFTEPIPRKLWKNKPTGPPIQYFDLNDYGNFIGLTQSIIGDGWITGGWFGVFLNMSIAGFGLGIFYNWFINNQNNIFKVTFYMITASVLLQLFRDGGIVTMAKFMLFTQMPVIFWWSAYKWTSRSESPDLYNESTYSDEFSQEYR